MQEQMLNAQTVGEQEAGFKSLLLSLLSELVAQQAEANEYQKKCLSNPLLAIKVPRWAWFKYNNFKYILDATEVASVSSPDANHCVIIMRNEGGPDPGRWCDGSFSEVCAKLGIQMEEK
jgi:hypothetical protein